MVDFKPIKNNYTILDTIGQGSYGIVYQAINTKINKLVALKLLKRKRRKGLGYIETLDEVEHEVKILKTLSSYPECSKYVVCFYDLFATKYEGIEYYAIEYEYIKGYDMQTLTNERKKFTSYESCLMVKQLLEGLVYMHSKNVVHRDIKPANIMFSDSRLVYIDFGISCFLTDCFGQVGTIRFMAPEIKANSVKYWKKADVYALGETIKYILSNNTEILDI
ncbi:MAG: serine/threonine-protein kinase, partial [Romboutsia sp.]|nr:serine/threonine-protein kinase [Romboutsia sp.]